MKPGKPLTRSPLERKPLKRKSASNRKQGRRRVSLVGFHEEVCDNACALADGHCRGQLDAHHFTPKNRLRRLVPTDQLEAALTDARNGVPTCRFHHEQVEWRRVECPVPPYHEAFLRDFGLIHVAGSERAA